MSFVVAGGIAVALFAARDDAPMRKARTLTPPVPTPQAAVATGQPLRCGPEWIPKDRVVTAAGDDQLAEYLALAPPVGLNFDPANEARKEESLKRFHAWIQAKTELGKKLQARYEASLVRDDASSIVAASNIALLSKSFSDDLLTIAIPEDVRSGEFADEKVEAFCDAMTEVAEPLETRALYAYGRCVTRARTLSKTARPDELQLLVNAARPCLAELARMKPDEYPLVEEVFQAEEVVRLRIELGSALPDDGSVVEYDRVNVLGVVLRTNRDFEGARRAYRRAITVDQARPEAHHNLGVLSMHEATTKEPEESIAMYEEASRHFARAAERATGTLRDAAREQAALVEKYSQQTRKYLDAAASK